MEYFIKATDDFDAICVSLHGATCTVSEEDACGTFLKFLRDLVGSEKVIAASCDLHANVTEKMLAAADIICGYQSYPHVDFYETGYRAANPVSYTHLSLKLLIMEVLQRPRNVFTCPSPH